MLVRGGVERSGQLLLLLPGLRRELGEEAGVSRARRGSEGVLEDVQGGADLGQLMGPGAAGEGKRKRGGRERVVEGRVQEREGEVQLKTQCRHMAPSNKPQIGFDLEVGGEEKKRNGNVNAWWQEQ